MIVADGLTNATVVLAAVTGLLALATIISVAFGIRGYRDTSREIEQAHRPVVTPIGRTGGPEPGGPVVEPGACLYLLVENVGPGPALRLVATVTLLSIDGQPSAALAGLRGPFHSPETAGLAAGAKTRLVIPLGWPGLGNYELLLTYNDVAERGLLTVGRFDNAKGTYTDVSLNTQAEGPYRLNVTRGALVRPVKPPLVRIPEELGLAILASALVALLTVALANA